MYLKPDKIREIIHKSTTDHEYLLKKLNKMRLYEIKQELSIKSIESEM